MKAIVVGGGIAGLAAAWRLRERGAEVVLVERDEELGGRCRTHFWQGAWRIRGAFAFIQSETNLIEQAKALGIYDSGEVVDLTEGHEMDILHKRKKAVRLNSVAAKDILLSPLLGPTDKAKLAAALPKLAAQISRNDPRDLTSAAALDTQSACAYFRKLSPAFVDYILEPCMQTFCGYEEDDYSIAWLVWLMAGHQWAGGWWTFRELGVGVLTRAMAEHLGRDPGCQILAGTTVARVDTSGAGVTVSVRTATGFENITGDAVVMALPAPLQAPLLANVDDARRGFLASVGYVGHHIVHYLLDTAASDLPDRLVLPTKDGWQRVSNLHFLPNGDGKILASGEVKGGYCKATTGAPEDKILDEVWEDFVEAAPSARAARVIDRHLQRNDMAICRREAGFVKRLAAFRALPPLPNVAFAGDYMINSTVGQAHWSGLQAADALLEVQSAATKPKKSKRAKTKSKA